MDMTSDQTLQESCMGALRHMGVEVTALIDKTNRLEDENERLRELVLKNWYIVLSEREVLKAYNIDSDGGTYMAALNNEIAIAKDRMQELKIKMDN